MAAEVLRAIAGIAIYPVVSLLVFLVVFTGVVIWTARGDRRLMDRLAQLPLEGDAREDHTR